MLGREIFEKAEIYETDFEGGREGDAEA